MLSKDSIYAKPIITYLEGCGGNYMAYDLKTTLDTIELKIFTKMFKNIGNSKESNKKNFTEERVAI